MDKRWVIKEVDENVVDKLYNELKISRTICKLLAQRGITTFEEAKRFFRPSLEEHLYDPFLMKDMDKAVERIDRAIHNKEKILIYGDYDVDGTTSVACVYSFFKDFYFYMDYYIPNRYNEGYGISQQGIDWAKENGFSLIIALDCGIKAIDKIEYAKTLGIDFIICDHHRPEDILPSAYAVLDPKRADCGYPYKELSGCGIGFKMIQAFAKVHDIPFSKVAQLLDFVAVSIAADIVPITDENRVLAYYGLKRLNKSPRPGFRSLIEQSGKLRNITVSDIVFMIAPRINAAGRMDDARQAVKLLLSQEGVIAKRNANVLQEKNSERRRIDTDITEEALALLETDPLHANRVVTVLYQPHWHKGVIGIVASRLLERFYRPTIIMALANGMVAGSARSVRGFDIYNALKRCDDLLDQFGGHKYAAGLSMREENVPAFLLRFEEIVASSIEDYMLVPEIEIDAEVEITDITSRFYDILRQFAPFGPGNMRPIFVTRDLTSTPWTAVVGKNHLKIGVRPPGGRNVFKGIAYNMGNRYKEVANGKSFDLCFSIQESEYNGSQALQMNVKDIKDPSQRQFEETSSPYTVDSIF